MNQQKHENYSEWKRKLLGSISDSPTKKTYNTKSKNSNNYKKKTYNKKSKPNYQKKKVINDCYKFNTVAKNSNKYSEIKIDGVTISENIHKINDYEIITHSVDNPNVYKYYFKNNVDYIKVYVTDDSINFINSSEHLFATDSISARLKDKSIHKSIELHDETIFITTKNVTVVGSDNYVIYLYDKLEKSLYMIYKHAIKSITLTK